VPSAGNGGRVPGRPKLPKGGPKGKFLRVQVTSDELRMLNKTARTSAKCAPERPGSTLAAALGR